MKAEQISSIKILKQNKFYRIADLFYRDGNRWEHDRKEILKNPIYKNTILYDYLSQKTTESDFNLFKKIALNHANKYKTKPKPDELVFHLRLGDAFDKNGKDRINNRIDWSRLQYKVFLEETEKCLKN